MNLLKTKAKIRFAVNDYKSMFPQEYKELLGVIAYEKQNLDTEMAEVKSTHAIKRALFMVSEKLSVMIAKKLDEEEVKYFKTKESGRWFATEFPQFRLSKEV